MRARVLPIVLTLPFLVAAGGSRYRNDALKVRAFEAPLGWEAQAVGSYARLLAAWETKDGGRMTLVAQKVKEGTSARSLADQSRPALERQGFRDITLAPVRPAGDDSDRVVLEASIEEGRRFVKQLYVVAGSLGYVVTVAGPIARAAAMRHDFDEAAVSLSVGDSGDATPNPKR